MVGTRKSTGSRMRLGSPLAEELEDFCAVVYAVDEIKVVRKAVAEHIMRVLEENDGLRREYEARRRARLEGERSGDRRLRAVED